MVRAITGGTGRYASTGGDVSQEEIDADEYYMAVVFESKEAYVANAHSPEQDARYRAFRELLAEDPEWHDGEIVFTAWR